jgi:MFS family permease
MFIGPLRHVRRHTFASLSSPNYRLFFGGVVISTSGTWIQLIAENWLIIKLDGSGLALGVNTALHLVPTLLLGPYAGVMLDRWDTRRVVLVAQIVAGGLATALGLLTLTGVVQTWMVWIAGLLVGCVNAFHSPAREAFSAELVGADLVANAVALTTAVVVCARAVGPAVGGLLVAGVGIAACFLFNAASYAVGAAALLAMNPRRLTVQPRQQRADGQIVAVLRHVWRHPALRAVLVMVTVTGVLGSNVQLLLTLLANTDGRGPTLYGVMMSCLGSGMVVGSLVSAGWHRPTIRGVGLLATAMGGAFLLTAFTPGLVPALVVIAALGVASGMFFASSSGSLQLTAGPGMRGRVMALYVVASLGPAALGSPLIGWIAATWNIHAALVITGVSCLTACLAGIRRRRGTGTAQPVADRPGGTPAHDGDRRGSRRRQQHRSDQ